MGHQALLDVADRIAAINKSLKAGSLSADDGKYLLSNYCYKYSDSELAVGRMGAADLDRTDDDSDTIWFTTTVLEEDRDGDVVLPRGRMGDNYAKSPAWFFGHQDWAIPIGTSWDNDGRVMVEVFDDRIRQGCRFDMEDEDAHFLHGKVRRKFLNGTSIAFVPVEAERRDEFEKARTHSKPQLPPGWLFKRWDHTETSIVGVGSNPHALAEMREEERKNISPRMYKCLGEYCAKARGRCFTGYCPAPVRRKSCGCKGKGECECSKTPGAMTGGGIDPDKPGNTNLQRGGPRATGAKAATQADIESGDSLLVEDRTDKSTDVRKMSRDEKRRLVAGLIEHHELGQLEDWMQEEGLSQADAKWSIDHIIQQLARGYGGRKHGLSPYDAANYILHHTGDKIKCAKCAGKGQVRKRLCAHCGASGVRKDAGPAIYATVALAKLGIGAARFLAKLGVSAYEYFMGKKQEGKTPEQAAADAKQDMNQKALNTASGSAGGYTVPPADRKRKAVSGSQAAGELDESGKLQRNGGKGKPVADTDTPGYVVCAECDGTGNCGACDGDGEDCSTCGGSGECPDCSGVGHVQKKADKKGLKMFVVKTAIGYVAKENDDDEEFTDDAEMAKLFDDADDAQEKADEVDGEVEEVDKDSVDEPFNPMPGASFLAKLHRHAKSETDFVDQALKELDNPGLREAIGAAYADGARPSGDALKALVDEHYQDQGDGYFDKVLKAMEGDTGGSGQQPTGEENLVEAGEIPPEETEEAPVQQDPATEEILERYQDEKGFWREKSAGRIRVVQGKKYLVRKQPIPSPAPQQLPDDEPMKDAADFLDGMSDDDDVPKSYRGSAKVLAKGLRKAADGAYVQGSGKSEEVDEGETPAPFNKEAAKDAADFLSGVSEDDDVPKGYRSGAKAHAKALTEAGKLQRNGGSGSELTDAGKLQRNGGSGSTTGDGGGSRQGKPANKPHGEYIVGSGKPKIEDGGPDGTAGRAGAKRNQFDYNKALQEEMEATQRMFRMHTGLNLGN